MRHQTPFRLATVVAAALFVLILLSAPATAQVTDERPHATVYTVNVSDDGDATWTIQLRYRLIGSEEQESFEGIREEFENGNLTVFEGIEGSLEPFAEEAANQTGRSMTVSGFERDVRIRETLTLTEGIVSVTFNWTNFAAANGSVVRVGDVFEGGGLALTEDERLVIERPDLPLRSAAPEPDISDSDRLVWDGEVFFEEGQPQVVFGEELPGGGGDGNGSDGNGSGGDGDGADSGSPSAAAIVAGFFVLVSGFAGGFYLSRSGYLGGDDDDADDAGSAAEPEATNGDDLLSDEDRVVGILRSNGGKMKQAEIVDNTDWSKSKVSMLLSDMEDDGTISKLRLGRENVIELEDDTE